MSSGNIKFIKALMVGESWPIMGKMEEWGEGTSSGTARPAERVPFEDNGVGPGWPGYG